MRISDFGRYALCISVALLAACGGSQPPIGAPGTMARGHIQRAVTVRAEELKTANSFLYVGNAFGSGSTFVVYLLRGSKPLREIKRDWNVYAIAIDPWGDVYTTDRMPSGGWGSSRMTTVAGARRCSLSTMTPIARWRLMVPATSTLTIRSSSESTKRAAPSCYAPLDWTHTTVDALAFDNTGNFYAAQLSTSESGDGKGVVKVHPPGKDQPSRKITKGTVAPVAMIFDADGNLAANCPGCYYGKSRGWVAEYPPGGSAPLRVLKSGIYDPVALALGNNRQLFVANASVRRGAAKSWLIAVYRLPGTAAAPHHRRH